MSLIAAIEPTVDLEVYLGYAREGACYADFADIRSKLSGVAPMFDFDRTMTNPAAHIVSVRDGDHIVRGMAVMVGGVIQLYYADDAQTTRALMARLEEVTNGQPASNQ